MTENLIRTIDESAREDALATLVMAFSNDPVMRWLYPEPQAYLQHFPGFVTSFAGKAFRRETAHLAAGGRAAALWLPPGEAPDEEAVTAHIGRTLPPARQETLFSLVGQIDSCHPQAPHWYLPFIGVDPAQHGRGLGSALIRHVTAICDRDRVLAYLESSNPANLPLYERHGFQVTAEVRAGDAPPVFPMVRQPR